MNLIATNLEIMFNQLDTRQALWDALDYLHMLEHVTDVRVIIPTERNSLGWCEVQLGWVYHGRYYCIDTPARTSVDPAYILNHIH